MDHQKTTANHPLHDRVAIITGASRGIGKQIAIHLSTLGAKLIINYTSSSSQPLAATLVSHLNSAATTPRAAAFQADISDEAQVTALFDFAERTFGTQPHIVVTSAGVMDTKYPTIADTSTADFDRIFSVNARGTFLCIKEAGKRVKRGGGGRIVTFSSSLAAAFKPRCGAYTTMEEMVAKAVEESPLGRLGTVEDIAPVVGFLVGDSGEWVNGQIIRVNGGYV